MKYCCVLLEIIARTLFQTVKINQAACDLAKGVAQEGGVYFAGSICQTAFLYPKGAGKDVVMKKFREQIAIFLQNDVDLIIAEVSSVLSCICVHTVEPHLSVTSIVITVNFWVPAERPILNTFSYTKTPLMRPPR